MFISMATYQARAGEEDAIIALHEEWERKQGLQAKDQIACELLRSSAAPREFITIVHASSKEVAQAVVDRLEQDALYSRLVSLIEGQITCSDYTRAWQFQ